MRPTSSSFASRTAWTTRSSSADCSSTETSSVRRTPAASPGVQWRAGATRAGAPHSTTPQIRRAMGDLSDTRIRVIKADEVIWEEAMTESRRDRPAGQGVHRGDVRRRQVQLRALEARRAAAPLRASRTTRSPTSSRARSRSPTTTATSTWPAPATSSSPPRAATGYWKNLTPVKKVWGIYEEADAGLTAYIGPGGF